MAKKIVAKFSFYFPQAELIDPALKGTLNVLQSCAKVPSIKRIVLTSSIAAVAYNGKPRTPEVVVDETWWSDPEVCRNMQVNVLFLFFWMRNVDHVTNAFNMVISLRHFFNKSFALLII